MPSALRLSDLLLSTCSANELANATGSEEGQKFGQKPGEKCGRDRYELVLWLIWPLASAFATHQLANALCTLLIWAINNLKACIKDRALCHCHHFL